MELELKSIRTAAKNLLEKVSQKLKTEKGKISELEDRSMEITISEEHRKKIKVKSTRTSGSCWITLSTPIYVVRELHKVKKRKETQKFLKNNALKLLKFDEKH